MMAWFTVTKLVVLGTAWIPILIPVYLTFRWRRKTHRMLRQIQRTVDEIKECNERTGPSR